MALPPKLPTSERSPLTVGVLVVTVIAAGFTLWALRTLVAPLALAMFLLLMIDGLARTMGRRAAWLPGRAALPAAILVIVAAFALSVWVLSSNIKQIVEQAGAYGDRLDTILARASDRYGVGIPSSLDALLQEVNPSRYAGDIIGAIRSVAESTIFVLIYLAFLLASRAGFEGKLNRLFTSSKRRAEAGRILERVRRGVENYIWVQTLTGLLIAAASAAVMAVLGLSHVLFWAFIIFLASYIPVLGAAIGVLIPPLFSLVELSDLWRSVVMLVALEIVHFLFAQVAQPRLQGRSLNLDPVVVVFALAFWALLWGVTGAFLSTPLTVLAMVVLAEFPSTRWLAVLLSRDGRPFEGE